MIEDIAVGPMMKGEQELPHQIVLRARLNPQHEITEFIVHLAVYDDKKISYSHGDYFPAHGPMTVEIYQKALKKFLERVEAISRHQLPYLEINNHG